MPARFRSRDPLRAVLETAARDLPSLLTPPRVTAETADFLLAASVPQTVPDALAHSATVKASSSGPITETSRSRRATPLSMLPKTAVLATIRRPGTALINSRSCSSALNHPARCRSSTIRTCSRTGRPARRGNAARKPAPAAPACTVWISRARCSGSSATAASTTDANETAGSGRPASGTPLRLAETHATGCCCAAAHSCSRVVFPAPAGPRRMVRGVVAAASSARSSLPRERTSGFGPGGTGFTAKRGISYIRLGDGDARSRADARPEADSR